MCGHGRGWNRSGWPEAVVPSGYGYVGPCRCGTGPHAFYQDRCRKVYNTNGLCCGTTSSAPTIDDLKSELDTLNTEKQKLEKRIEELKKTPKGENR